MKNRIKSKIFNYLNRNQIERKPQNVSNTNNDFTKFELDVILKVENYTMTSPERIVSLIRAVDYIIKNNIEGDIVECGVWKGGSIMAVLHALKLKNDETKKIFLYDTYEGMTEPTDLDFSYNGTLANETYQDKQGNWCYSSLEEVKKNIETLNYPNEKILYIKGKVEETIPDTVPNSISILRLDTDWYESTLHEMEYLFPKLVKGGIIIIDDYGHWSGCKKAVDEYLEKNNIVLFLSRVDYTCRIGVKV